MPGQTIQAAGSDAHRTAADYMTPPAAAILRLSPVMRVRAKRAA
jgi:hypothetical protein